VGAIAVARHVGAHSDLAYAGEAYALCTILGTKTVTFQALQKIKVRMDFELLNVSSIMKPKLWRWCSIEHYKGNRAYTTSLATKTSFLKQLNIGKQCEDVP